MHANLVISVSVMPAEPLSALSVGQLRGQTVRCTRTGFAAWLGLRPVLHAGARAALLLVQIGRVVPEQLLAVLQEHVQMLQHQVRAGYLVVQAPWEQRSRMEVLLVDMYELARANEDAATRPLTGRAGGRGLPPASVEALRGDAPALPSGGGEGDSVLPSRPADADTRHGGRYYSRTDEGKAARAILSELGNAAIPLLGRLRPRTWKLPQGVQVREGVHGRNTVWRVELADGSEGPFWALVERLPAPLQLVMTAGEPDVAEGDTAIDAASVSAPIGDAVARKRFAAFLWELLHLLWGSTQQQSGQGGRLLG